jgi:hypothetical protein
MKSQLLKAEMKSLTTKPRQKVQYLYHQDYEGDQRKFNLVYFTCFPFLWLQLPSQQMKLNRAHAEVGPSHHERKEDIGAPIKLDAEAQAHIEKHRYAIFFFLI